MISTPGSWPAHSLPCTFFAEIFYLFSFKKCSSEALLLRDVDVPDLYFNTFFLTGPLCVLVEYRCLRWFIYGHGPAVTAGQAFSLCLDSGVSNFSLREFSNCSSTFETLLKFFFHFCIWIQTSDQPFIHSVISQDSFIHGCSAHNIINVTKVKYTL